MGLHVGCPSTLLAEKSRRQTELATVSDQQEKTRWARPAVGGKGEGRRGQGRGLGSGTPSRSC